MHVVCDCYIQAAQFNKLLFLYLIFYKKEPKNKFWVLFSISRTKDAFVQLESLSLSYEGQKQLDLQRQDR